MPLVVINVDKENLAKELVNAHYEYVGVYLKVFDFYLHLEKMEYYINYI